MGVLKDLFEFEFEFEFETEGIQGFGARLEVGRDEGPTHGGVHEDEVDVLGGVNLAAGEHPTHGAPVEAAIGVVLKADIWGHLRHWVQHLRGKST